MASSIFKNRLASRACNKNNANASHVFSPTAHAPTLRRPPLLGTNLKKPREKKKLCTAFSICASFVLLLMVILRFLYHDLMISISSPGIMAANHLDGGTVKVESSNDNSTTTYAARPKGGFMGEEEVLLPANNTKDSLLLDRTQNKPDACLSPERNVS